MCIYVCIGCTKTLQASGIRDRTCLRLVYTTDDQEKDDGDIDPCDRTHGSDTVVTCNHTQLNTLLQQSQTLITLLEKVQAERKEQVKLLRVDIVRAMGLSRGHWYKCRCGFVYCIGNCGGAAQIASCPRCDGSIGGENHRLVEGNTVAPEMVDGSIRSDYKWVGLDGR